MKKLILITFFLILSTCSFATAQTTEEVVTISKEAAVTCLENSDKVIALLDEVKVKDEAIISLKMEVLRMQVEVANVVGQKTQLEASLIRQNAIIDILLKSVRAKKIGIVNFE